MRAIKRSIADARDEREAREREAREREARERETQEREAREREARERLLLGSARSADNPIGVRDVPETVDATSVHDLRDPAGLERAVFDDRDTLDARALESATCEHVTRELATRIDMRPRTSLDGARDMRSAPRRDVPPLRCEPCPRVIPSRRLFDGSLLQQFRCDGSCARDQERARNRQRAHVGKHTRWDQANVASKHELRVQIAVTTVLAVLAAMWIVLAAREASAEPSRDAHANTRAYGDDDDDDAIDVAAPPTRDAPFGGPVVAPPIADVVSAAYRTAGLDRDVGSALVRRSRLGGLVPLVSVRTGRNTSWRDDEPDISRGMTLEVRATWRLDRLVFDGRELQVVALEAARRRERRRLAARVIQVYFAWKRAARGAGIQPRAAATAEEAAAELDDLTGGWFTEAREGQRP